MIPVRKAIWPWEWRNPDSTRAQDGTAKGMSERRLPTGNFSPWPSNSTRAWESGTWPKRHLPLSRDTVMTPASSLPGDKPLRQYHSHPEGRKILVENRSPASETRPTERLKIPAFALIARSGDSRRGGGLNDLEGNPAFTLSRNA
jgi:hypothetical protein